MAKNQISRRRALARLGLAASAAYMAPSLMVLKRAKAGGSGGGSGGGSYGGGSYGGGGDGRGGGSRGSGRPSFFSPKSKPSTGRGGRGGRGGW